MANVISSEIVERKICEVVYNEILGIMCPECHTQLFFGRSQYQTPEADTLVYFKSKKPIEIGKFYKVKITKVKGYDLQGEVEDEI